MSLYKLCLSLSVWVTSLRMTFLNSWIVLHFVNLWHFLYLILDWGASRLFPGSINSRYRAWNGYLLWPNWCLVQFHLRSYTHLLLEIDACPQPNTNTRKSSGNAAEQEEKELNIWAKGFKLTTRKLTESTYWGFSSLRGWTKHQGACMGLT